MRQPRTTGLMVAAVLAACLPASAWGPHAQVSIVTTAARLIAKENAIPLTNLLDDIRSGAQVSQATLHRLVPRSDVDPVSAIASEMNLLQAVRTERVDPYYAFRLGVLGKLVAVTTSPVAGTRQAYRALYEADAEKHVGGAVLRSAPKRDVDPAVYFPILQREATARQLLVEKEYEEGIGFRGIASQSFSEDVSRSVNAARDVWHTILQSPVRVVNIAPERLHNYYVEALEFYIRRGHPGETQRAYDQLMGLTERTPELQKRIGDMFYEADQYERAVQEYRGVLEAQPGRRDVIERITAYYLQVGDEALKDGRLEGARDAFEEAARVDRLSTVAQERLLEAEKQIAERDQRLARDRETLEAASRLGARAEDLLRQGNRGEAMDLFQQATDLYAAVTPEFSAEWRKAQSGLDALAKRTGEIRDQLLSGSRRLSGAGSSTDVHILAEDQIEKLAQDSLQELLKKRYREEVRRQAAGKSDQLRSPR